MRVLVFTPFNFSPSFLGLNLEFIQKEIDMGNEVTVVTCQRSFPMCGFNTYGLKYMCEICTKRFNDHIDLVEGNFESKTLSDIVSENHYLKARKLLNLNRLVGKELVVEDFKVGEAVFSSLISKTKEKSFDNREDQRILEILSVNALSIYFGLKQFLNNKKFVKIILFNGRWDYYRATLAAANKIGIRVDVIENFRRGGYYEIFKNVLPHDIKAKNALVENHWNKESNNNKQSIAKMFFSGKREGKAMNDRSYSKDHVKGVLPDYINREKKILTIYNSSDFEFEAVGEDYKVPFFKDQDTAIIYVAKLISERNDFQLVVRMHPNLAGLRRDYLDQIYGLEGKFDNVFIVKPEDKVDSYTLLDASYKILTFVSTIGIEASYWGKPVVLLGTSVYSFSNVAYVPDSKENIETLLFSDLQPKPKEAAEKYGYYFMTGGIKAKYYEGGDMRHQYFKGRSLSHFNLPFTTYYRLLKLLGFRNNKGIVE